MQPQTGPSPELFMDTLFSFQRSAAVKAAVELDVFSKIADGRQTAAEIAEDCGASERGARILCDCLTVMGFLTKNDNRYALTESSRVFLARQSPAYFGGAVEFLLSPTQVEGFNRLTEAVKKGGTAVTEDMGLDPENPVWVKFARGMMPMMMIPAEMIAESVELPTDRPLKVLDISASHGIYGIKIAQKYPKAEIYAVDWSNVLEVARENAEKFGVADRYHTIAGSAFDVDFGDGFDLALIPNFLHHFSKETNVEFMRKIYSSLRPGGKAVTVEMVPNDDRVSPPQDAMFALVMLASTPDGDAYTFNELKEIMDSAGFSDSRHIRIPNLPQNLVISSKSE